MRDDISKKPKDIYEIKIRSTDNRAPEEIFAEIIEKKASKICGLETIWENHRNKVAYETE